MIKKLSLLTLTLFIIGSIDSLRNLPATAIFGTDLIFFLSISAVLFLIPCALICAELATLDTKEAGVYAWVKHAFGAKVGMVAIWLQWINTMIWFPTILSFIAAVALHLINPQLSKNPYVLISIIIVVYWCLTLLNLKGVRISGRFAAVCGVIGMALPMTAIIILGLIWIIKAEPMAIHFSGAHLIPNFEHTNSWISLTAIMASFLGIELTAVHIRDIENPKKTFAKAMLVATIFIIVTMLAGAFAIAMVIPVNKLSLIDGIMETFSYYLQHYHLGYLVPVMGVMILVGAIGGMVNWMISPAKGLLQAAEDGFIPKALQKTNESGVATRLLILQAIIVSFMCSAFLFMPSVNGSYWLLTDLSTQLYMLMYFILFVTALSLGLKAVKTERLVFVPAGKAGLWFFCLLGMLGTFITITVGFIPPKVLDVGSFTHYEMIFAIGMFTMILPGILIAFRKKKPKHRTQDAM